MVERSNAEQSGFLFGESTFCPQRQRRYVLFVAILASALGFIDGSIVSIAIPALRTELGASLNDAQWIANGYMLMLASLILVGGAMGDRFGLKRVFSIGIGVFILASAACAIAPDPAFLIAARIVQGVGAALMTPASLAIIAKAYPAGERGRAIGIWAAASAITTAIGPVLGGLLLDSGLPQAWRLIFAINLPLGGLALIVLMRSVPADPPSEPKPIDYAGAVLATLALGLLAYALTMLGEGRAEEPAMRPVWATAAAGLMALAGFMWRQSVAAYPMMPLTLFASRAFSVANSVTFLVYFALSAVLFFLPMTLISGWGVSQSAASLVFIPITLAVAAMSGWSGRMADTHGARPLLVGGATIVSVAYLGLAVGFPLQSFALHVVPMMVLMSIGMGLLVSPLSTLVMNAVAESETGLASGINNAIARAAGLVAVAAMGALAAAVYDAGYSAADLAGEASVWTGFGETPAENLSAADDMVRRQATNAAFMAVAYVTAALAGIAAMIARVFLPHRTPD
jgi:EmrB/QacA subfamily drug resistance transporter